MDSRGDAGFVTKTDARDAQVGSDKSSENSGVEVIGVFLIAATAGVDLHRIDLSGEVTECGNAGLKARADEGGGALGKEGEESADADGLVAAHTAAAENDLAVPAIVKPLDVVGEGGVGEEAYHLQIAQEHIVKIAVVPVVVVGVGHAVGATVVFENSGVKGGVIALVGCGKLIAVVTAMGVYVLLGGHDRGGVAAVAVVDEADRQASGGIARYADVGRGVAGAGGFEI